MAMKGVRMKFLVLLMLLQLSLSYAQAVSKEQPPEEQEETFPLDEQSLSDLAIEADRQEDVLHPEGEVNDWGLGSDDLPSDDFQ
jgi:hypothetical protein